MARNRLELLDERTLAEAAGCFGLRSDQLHFAGGFQNIVYETDGDGQGYILRLTHPSRRSPALIRSELDWVLYLSEREVPVSRPVKSRGGLLCEAAGEFTAVVFEKAPGRRPGHVEELEQLGRITGRMHALAKGYQPPDGVVRRFRWHENDYLNELRAYIPAEETAVHATIDRTLRQIHDMPTGPDSFGLIHGDLFPGNYRIDDAGHFTLFDFDEAQYGWFAQDLGILLFYTAAFPDETTRADVTLFLEQFIGGYRQENAIESFWLAQLPLFVRLRQAILYAGIHRLLQAGRRDLHPWQQAMFDHARHTLTHDLPPIDYPF